MKNNKQSKKKKGYPKIITIVLIITLIAGIVMSLGYYADWRSFAEAYVEYNGQIYCPNENSNITIPYGEGKTARFNIGGAGFDKAPKAFAVKIIPNPLADFIFISENKNATFERVGDLTKAFDLKYGGGFFEINCEKRYSPLNVISEVINSKANLPDGAVLNNNMCFFKMLITISDNAPITLNFYQNRIDPNIELPPEVLI